MRQQKKINRLIDEKLSKILVKENQKALLNLLVLKSVLSKELIEYKKYVNRKNLLANAQDKKPTDR